MKLLLGACAAFTTLTLAAPAEARLLSFTISGDYAAHFRLDYAPVPRPEYVVDGYLFGIDDVAIDAAGGPFRGGVTFFNAGATGGILLNRGFDYVLDAGGAQLYSGTEAAPAFRTGSYALAGVSTPGAFRIDIAAVPETATWAMLIAGFGATGVALRVRRRTFEARRMA